MTGPARRAMTERFLRSAPCQLPERELLELLLSYSLPEDKLALACAGLLDRFGSVAGALGADYEELSGVDGLTKDAAGLLALTRALIHRSALRNGVMGPVDSPSRAGEYLVPRLFGLEREMMYVLCLDRRLRFLSCRAVCEGSVSRLSVDAYGLIGEAMDCDADAVIIAHNHPNGIALPSLEDRRTTVKLSELLDRFGLVLLDHLVVSGQDFVSLASEGAFLPRPGAVSGLYHPDGSA